MKDIWTKAFASIATLTAGLFLTATVFAADANNSNTGADSDNEATVTIDNDININSENNAIINNNITVNADTGGNSASKNTGDGSIATGSIGGSVTITNT